MAARRRVTAIAAIVVASGMLGSSRAPSLAQEPAPGRREFSVSARKYAFAPLRLEAVQDDLVKVTFRAEDIAHSFTIDAYRIAKRAAAGQTIVFEFRADQPGTFRFYCNLASDDRCREMHGELVVSKR
jgi:heme/copper-type cytochrome/quinol oxidase subunit 2